MGWVQVVPQSVFNMCSRVHVGPTGTIYSNLNRQTHVFNPHRHLPRHGMLLSRALLCALIQNVMPLNATAQVLVQGPKLRKVPTFKTRYTMQPIPIGCHLRQYCCWGQPLPTAQFQHTAPMVPSPPHTHNVLHLQVLAVCLHFAVWCAQAPLLLWLSAKAVCFTTVHPQRAARAFGS